jgi:hypothetical protein
MLPDFSPSIEGEKVKELRLEIKTDSDAENH